MSAMTHSGGEVPIVETCDLGFVPPELEATLVDPLSDPAWDSDVAEHPSATFFHSAAWARVLEKTYGHRPYYLRFSSGERLAALVPLMEVESRWTGRRGVALPFTDSCEPLIFRESDRWGVFARLSAMARERNWRYLQFRGGPPPSEAARPSMQFYNHILDLRPDPVQLFAGLEGSVRRAVRKAERNGLKTSAERSIEVMRAFYRLHCLTRRRHGVPPQPWKFFQTLFDEVISPGGGFVALATADTTPVAASVFVRFGSKAVYKFGASDDTKQALRGNDDVMWEGIKSLAASGCESLDFGRTSLHNNGLRRFKLGWGAGEKTVQYYKWNPASDTWLHERDKSTGFHTAVFQRLPVSVNRLAGAILYPHLD